MRRHLYRSLLIALMLFTSITAARADTIITVWTSAIVSGYIVAYPAEPSVYFSNSLVTFTSTVDLTQLLYDCSVPVSGLGCGGVSQGDNFYQVDDTFQEIFGNTGYVTTVSIFGLGAYNDWSNILTDFTYDPVANTAVADFIVDTAFNLALGPAEADFIGDSCYDNLPPNWCPVSTGITPGYLVLTSEDFDSYQTGGSVQITGTPEPETLLLVATGLFGFAGAIRRRKNIR